jgi:hypothetical protein
MDSSRGKTLHSDLICFSLTNGRCYHKKERLVGTWLSLVEHSVRDAGVAGSNPVVPTTTPQIHAKFYPTSFFYCMGFPPHTCFLITDSSGDLNPPVHQFNQSHSLLLKAMSHCGRQPMRHTFRLQFHQSLFKVLRISVYQFQNRDPSLQHLMDSI